jgi:hypothetical protein
MSRIQGGMAITFASAALVVSAVALSLSGGTAHASKPAAPKTATTVTAPIPPIADQNCLMYQTGVMVCSTPEGRILSVTGGSSSQ